MTKRKLVNQLKKFIESDKYIVVLDGLFVLEDIRLYQGQAYGYFDGDLLDTPINDLVEDVKVYDKDIDWQNVEP